MDIIKSIFEEKIKTFITTQWNNIVLWRWCALVAVIMIVSIWTFRNKIIEFISKPEIKAHDKKIFCQIEKILPESFLRTSIEYFENIHPILMDFSSKLYKLQLFRENIENAFINKKLNCSFNFFINRSLKLSNFIGDHYFAINDKWSKMYPSDDSNSERYLKAKRMAPDIAKEFMESYCSFRLQIRKILLV